MTANLSVSAGKFDASRAAEYASQSRIALAGYDACHELTACVLAAALAKPTARVLVGGAGGTAQEILTTAKLEPGWHFTAVDPSPQMIETAQASIRAVGLDDRVEWRAGTIGDLPPSADFDAATLIGVLHHLPEAEMKRQILSDIALRLKPGAPFIIACNHYPYADEPLRLAAWRQRWRMFGAGDAEIKAKLGKIQHGAKPPESEAAVLALLDEAGFEQPMRFFSSLFWSAWAVRRR